MEITLIATIITVLGTGILAGFGYFMKHLIDGMKHLINDLGTKIDKLETDLTTRIDKLETDLGTRIDKLEAKVDKLSTEVTTLKVSVAAMAATQQEHGDKLQHMMQHGERISTLEGAVFGRRNIDSEPIAATTSP